MEISEINFQYKEGGTQSHHCCKNGSYFRNYAKYFRIVKKTFWMSPYWIQENLLKMLKDTDRYLYGYSPISHYYRLPTIKISLSINPQCRVFTIYKKLTEIHILLYQVSSTSFVPTSAFLLITFLQKKKKNYKRCDLNAADVRLWVRKRRGGGKGLESIINEYPKNKWIGVTSK